jgi:hypothetical protein
MILVLSDTCAVSFSTIVWLRLTATLRAMSSVCCVPISFQLRAQEVADNVIGPNGLLSTKARILVTNSIAFIHQFDSLAFIRRGIILEKGSYQSLIANPNSEISKLV